MCYGLSCSWYYTTFYLVPLKYVFAALYMQNGSQKINAHLRVMAVGRYHPDSPAVAQLTSLQDQLSRTFGPPNEEHVL